MASNLLRKLQGWRMSADSFDWQKIGQEVTALRKSQAFRRSASNAVYNVTDYLAQPVLMVVFAPLLVRHLGLDHYGLWMLVSALAGTFGILQVGLGDATTKYVSAYRGQDDLPSVVRVIRGTLTLSILLSGLTTLTLFLLAPILVRHVFKIEPSDYLMATRAIQIGTWVLLLRSVSAVFSNTLRAHEAYGPSTRITAFVKVAIVASAVALALGGRGVVAIMYSTVGLTVVGLILLVLAVQRLLPGVSFWPTLETRTWREVFHFSLYSWIQGISSSAFSQADRLLIAGLLGTSALAYYTICVQLAQQVHGLPAAAFDFLFPHVSAKHRSGKEKGVKRVYRLAIAANILLSASLTLPLVFFGRRILSMWMGKSFADHSYLPLSILALSFFMLSLNVAPHFTLLGLGKIRFVSLTNLFGGALSLVGAVALIPPLGLIGAATGRLFYGPVISMNYLKVESCL
jgi:O-antigen/teichoic acid export membrane protein